MSEDNFDAAFARHLRHAGLVTPEQLALAEKTRAGGSLSDSLVRLGGLQRRWSDAVRALAA